LRSLAVEEWLSTWPVPLRVAFSQVNAHLCRLAGSHDNGRPVLRLNAVLALMRKYAGSAKRGDLLALLSVMVFLALGLLTYHVL